MAERRMFAKSIVESDAFIDMPLTTQALYFHLGMNADDDGFVGNPKAIMRIAGAKQKDLENLLERRFILGFESGAVVVKHWRINNYLQTDRIRPTTYQEELKKLTFDDKNAYTECIQDVYKKPQENGDVYKMYTKCIHSIEENRTDKDSIEECNKSAPECAPAREDAPPSPFPRFRKPDIAAIRAYCESRNNNIDPQRFFDFYESKGWKVGNTPMKDWKAAVRTWEQRDKAEKQVDHGYEQHDYNTAELNSLYTNLEALEI